MQAHAAHAKAGRPGGMVMPPQSGPMMQGGPDDQPMAMGPGGMMMQPQLVQVPASAAGMHPQYQSFDGMHMQPAMHQVPAPPDNLALALRPCFKSMAPYATATFAHFSRLGVLQRHGPVQLPPIMLSVVLHHRQQAQQTTIVANYCMVSSQLQLKRCSAP